MTKVCELEKFDLFTNKMADNPGKLNLLIPENKHRMTMNAHFSKLLLPFLPKQRVDQHEYWILLTKKKKLLN